VEFAVVRASLASQLGNILVSALAIWLPLLPLWFFARRIIDARSGSSSKKLKRPVDMPRVTFADVAGEGARWQRLVWLQKEHMLAGAPEQDVCPRVLLAGIN
jgi:cell division protease FtsH